MKQTLATYCKKREGRLSQKNILNTIWESDNICKLSKWGLAHGKYPPKRKLKTYLLLKESHYPHFHVLTCEYTIKRFLLPT